MNILWVTYGLPYPPISGARLRDLNLIRQLAKRHAIHLFSLLEDASETDSVGELERFCASVETFPLGHQPLSARIDQFAQHVRARRPLATFPFMNHALRARLREVAAALPADAIQIEHSFLAPYVDALPPSFRGLKMLSLHNLGELQYQRLAQLSRGLRARLDFSLKAHLMRRWEAEWAARFDCVIAVSDVDAQRLVSIDPALPVAVIENGVDTRQCPLLPDAAEHRLLFVGTMGYAPNVDAMLWFCDRVLPRIQDVLPRVQLSIVGRAPAPAIRKLASRKNVSVTGQVADTTPHYRDASVVVVPLRAGGGTRLKILEAMAFGRPVVSTTLGCEGLAAQDGEHILIADSPAALADAVIRLLNDRARRERLAHNARRLAEERYDWSMIGGKLLALYDRLLTARRAEASDAV